MATRHEEMLLGHANERFKAKTAAAATRDAARTKAAGQVVSTLVGAVPKAMTGLNDLSWYSKILHWEDYTHIPMYWNPAQWLNYIATAAAGNVSLPLLACLRYAKTFGNATGASNISESELNYSIVEFVTKLRSKTSVSTSLDDSVFGLYLVAATEAYDLAFEIERDLKAARTAKDSNPYLGRLVLDAVGISNIATDIDDIYINYGKFRLEMERLIRNVPIPKSFDIVHRRRLMRSFLITDANIVKPQLYMAYCPYRGVFESSYSRVDYQSIGASTRVRINELTIMIQHIIEDSTMQEVLRAIRAGVPQEEFFSWELPGIEDPSLTLVPEYAPELLEQVHNAVSAPYHGSVDSTSLSVRTAPSGWLYQGVSMATPADELNPENFGIRFAVAANVAQHFSIPANAGNGVQQNLLLNFYDDKCDAGRIMEGTRLISTFISAAIDGNNYVITRLCGFEVITDFAIYYVDQQSTGHDPVFLLGSVYGHSRYLYTYTSGVISADGMSGYSAFDSGTYHLASCFDWFPILVMLSTADNTYDFIKHGEICKFAKLPVDILQQLHRVACISAMKLVEPKYLR